MMLRLGRANQVRPGLGWQPALLGWLGRASAVGQTTTVTASLDWRLGLRLQVTICCNRQARRLIGESS
jgi:hypothetical protein